MASTPPAADHGDAVFQVTLSGLNLSREQLERMERKVRSTVMAELASVDHKGDLVVRPLAAMEPRRLTQGIGGGHATQGIYVSSSER